jgi:hypothetical protein
VKYVLIALTRTHLEERIIRTLELIEYFFDDVVRFTPTSDPLLVFQFFSPEKVMTSSMLLEVDLPAPQSKKAE